MQILVVKLTSMGDVIQLLPAMTDLASAMPHAEIDWVVDTNFAQIPTWHPAVRGVIPSNHRKWRKNPLGRDNRQAIRRFISRLRYHRYDAVVDLQGNLKSASVTRLARGVRHGYAKGCTAERWVHTWYHHRHQVAQGQHAIQRMRDLLGAALGYSVDAKHLDFGLRKHEWPSTPQQPTVPYVVFVTNATWPNKRLPLLHWVELVHFAARAQMKVLLPWGTRDEYAFTQAIADQCDNAVLLPKLHLHQVASLLFYSLGAVCNDTGLAHLSAALDKPTLTLYGPTQPHLIAALGKRAGHLQAPDCVCSQRYRKPCAANQATSDQPRCLAALQPEAIWAAFETQSGVRV